MLGVHAFGAIINISAVIIMADRLTRATPLTMSQAQLLSRAFTAVAFFSPFIGGVALALAYTPGSNPLLLLAFGGPVLMFSALAKMPLADVTVIIFGSTFLTTALSVPLFKEKVGIHRWSAVILGFVGVVIALRPGAGVFEPIAILALLAGVAFSTINLTARWLRDTESTLSITFYTMAGMAVLASFAVPFVWQPIPLNDLVVFTIMSVFTIIGYLGMTGAFVIAPVSVVAPFEYTVMIFAVISGWVIWGDVPDEYVWTGAAIIVASGIYLIQREARLRNVEGN
jgi:drug/metabolite transporter (DMT)-like permease